MSISMYQASVPVFVRALTNLRAVLLKGEAFADEKGFSSDVLLQTRLIADMCQVDHFAINAADGTACQGC